MPYRIPSLAGKPYRPSNGTEGEMFQEMFCYRCTHDNFDEDTCSGGCPIISLTLCFDIDDPEYPKEWIHDDDGVPTCTKYDQKEVI